MSFLEGGVPTNLINKLLSGSKWKFRTITTNETLLSDDLVLLVDNTGAITLTLPDATLAENLGRVYLIIKKSGTAFFNVDGFGAQLVGRLAIQQLLIGGDYLFIICDGANWQIIGEGRQRGEVVAHWTESRTLTNIGTAFTQCYGTATADALKVFIQTAGKTQVRMIVNWTKVGVGTQTVRVLASVTTLIQKDVISGNIDTGWQDIPTDLLYVTAQDFLLQAKSTTATDDPQIHGCMVMLR